MSVFDAVFRTASDFEAGWTLSVPAAIRDVPVHLTDPIRFDEDLHVEIQALGWRSEGRYLPQQDDIASVAYWYQTEPHCLFPALPEIEKLEVN